MLQLERYDRHRWPLLCVAPPGPADTCINLAVLPCSVQANRADKRLAFLLKQAEVFQHFAPEQKAAGEDKKKK